MSPTQEGTARAKKAWETIRRKQAENQAKTGAAILKASKAASEMSKATSEIMKTDEAQKTRLSLERDLQAALRRNIEQLEPGLVIIDGGKERVSASGRMDILARDATGTNVIIELKVGKAGIDVFGQIQSYMGDLVTETGERVRGIIVANEFDSKAIAASKVVPNLEMQQYGFSFTFKRV